MSAQLIQAQIDYTRTQYIKFSRRPQTPAVKACLDRLSDRLWALTVELGK